VGRAEAAGHRDQVGPGDGVAKRPLELARLVADDHDACGLDAEREQRAGEVRAVEIGAVAANELAARGDDDRAGARAQARAATMRFAVT